ncbi:hypothetical protein CP532_2143 [Ophiocordyceps camponoti-leonardi (nom. inval.)]|nr:hypothetical protein CP532_2143 [Ophiocordyceps camponoti-leonardi (nom. inval.)]
MSSDAKNMTSQTQHDAQVGRSRKRGCVNHCKRFWWAYLLLLCAIVVLVVCLISQVSSWHSIFVAVPKIAQRKMDDSKLEIQGVHVLETTPDSYLMEINSTITTDGSIHANIDPFQGNLYIDSDENPVPFATLDFPSTASDKLVLVNISQTVQIKDHAAFTRFNTLFYQNKAVRVRLSGKTKVKPSGINRKYDVDFNKILEFDGLDTFSGAKVDGTVDIGAPTGSPNFRGTADIPNRSHFTLDVGNASFTNFADGQNIGSMTINNLIIRPGINKVNVEAELDQLKVLQIIGKKPYCDNGIVPFELLATDVVRNGEKLDYFATALASRNQTVNIDIGSILRKTIPGFSLSCSRA